MNSHNMSILQASRACSTSCPQVVFLNCMWVYCQLFSAAAICYVLRIRTINGAIENLEIVQNLHLIECHQINQTILSSLCAKLVKYGAQRMP